MTSEVKEGRSYHVGTTRRGNFCRVRSGCATGGSILPSGPKSPRTQKPFFSGNRGTVFPVSSTEEEEEEEKEEEKKREEEEEREEKEGTEEK